MPFKKGQSGNPAGRKPGLSTAVKIRNLLESRSDKLIKVVMARALDGDTTAQKLWLERICPVLKPKDLFVSIPDLNQGETLTDKGAVILKTLGSGELTPSEASSLLSALANQAKLTELDDLTRRLEKLEQA